MVIGMSRNYNLSIFTLCFGKLKKKNNEVGGGGASKPSKCCSIALLRKALENRGVT